MPRLLLTLAACLLLILPARAAEEVGIVLPAGVEVTSQRFAAAQGPVLLWFTGQYGDVEAERNAAAALAARGVEVWLTDWLAPYFLPQLPGSMAKVPARDLGDWLAALRQRLPGRTVVLLGSAHTADLALRAARDARERLGVGMDGALLLFPLLYRDMEVGAEPEYAPVVDATRLKLAVLVPRSSAGYWWRERLKARLEAAGSQVSLTVLPGLRDGFYRRSDATEGEVAAGGRLAEMLWQPLQDLMGDKTP